MPPLRSIVYVMGAVIDHLLSALPYIRGAARAAISSDIDYASTDDTKFASTISVDSVYRGYPIRQGDRTVAACSHGGRTDDGYCVEPHRCHLGREIGQAIIGSGGHSPTPCR